MFQTSTVTSQDDPSPHALEQVDEQGRLHVVKNVFSVNRKKWMAAAKAAFYADYRSKGGEREVKAWAKVRWTGGKL